MAGGHDSHNLSQILLFCIKNMGVITVGANL